MWSESERSFLNILFWNLEKKNNVQYLTDCIKEWQIDLIVLSEYENLDIPFVLNDLNNDYWHVAGKGGCDKITLIAQNKFAVNVKREQSRYVLYSIEYNNVKFNLVGTHLQDRRNCDPSQRIAVIARLMNDLKNLEDSSKCKKSIIIGDLNSNPYDRELLQMNAFHAVLFKDVIKNAETRTVDGVKYRRLYNPILHFLSEDTKNYGSFYDTRGSSSPTWHCLDQILVSKALVDAIALLKYLREINGTSLISRKMPRKEISDHLPLVVQMEEGVNDEI